MCFIYAFIEIRNGQQLGISPIKKKKKKEKRLGVLFLFFFFFFENQRLGAKSIKFYIIVLYAK